VVLKINGATEDDRLVVLGAGASEPVSFTVSPGLTGTYTVDVDGLSGTFRVERASAASPVAPTPGINWWVIGVIIGVGVALILFLLIRRALHRGGAG